MINSDTIDKFIEFVLDQSKESSPRSYISIKNAINAFSIPLIYLTIPKGTSLFRVRVHEPTTKEYSWINDISFIQDSQKILHFGRANEPLQSVFYCSTLRETAFFEVSNVARQMTNSEIEISTIGEWILKNEIIVATLPINKNIVGKNVFNDHLSIHIKDILEKFQGKDTKVLKKVLDFFSLEFTKEVFNKDIEYMISCAFANYIFDHIGYDIESLKTFELSGIIYPSVQYSAIGMNLALKSSVIKNKSLILSSVAKQKLERINEKKYIETDTLIAKKINRKTSQIFW